MRTLFVVAAVLIGATLGQHLACQVQCRLGYKAGQPAPGPVGTVNCTAWWDPDGAGPRPQLLVLGGTFTVPSIGAANLVMFDPAREDWSAFDGQPDSAVLALAVTSGGDLAIGGRFGMVGALPARCVAVYHDGAWQAPGAATPSAGVAEVRALAAAANGDLFVGGRFQQIGNVLCNGLARWDGSQWHALGAFTGEVNRLVLRANGNLVVGGDYARIGQPGYADAAEWDGSNWIHYGSGVGGHFSFVRGLAVLANGDVFVTGVFNIAGGVSVPGIARWDGSTWSAPGTEIAQPGDTLLPLPNGDLLLATVTTVAGNPVFGVARWNGIVWSTEAPFIGTVNAMTTMPNGDLLAAGMVETSVLGEPVTGVARWDGTTWHALSHGFDNTIRELTALANGDVVAFGDFRRAEGAAVSGLVRWTGQSWYPLTRPAGMGQRVFTTTDDEGRLWIAGDVSVMPGPAAVARWTGTGWQAVGDAIGSVRAMVIDDNGLPIIGCGLWGTAYGPRIARWTGATWSPLGNQVDGPVLSLLRLANGDLIAGGEFLFSGSTSCSRVARWDGSNWHPLGTGVDGPVRALARLPDGDLIAAGDFYSDGNRPLNLIARWDGTSWWPLGHGLTGDPTARVTRLLVLPNGDLLAAGSFRYAGGHPARGLARWDGSEWHAVDQGLDGEVLALTCRPDGEIFVGGTFARAGGNRSAHLARLRTDCPASVDHYGVACAGSNGPLALEADSRPWVGSRYRSTCFGISTTALAVELFGLSPLQTPLATLHPLAAPGCTLLVNSTFTTLHVPTNGSIVGELALPNERSLTGVVLFQQVIAAEIVGSTITTVVGSNGLQLTIGVL